MLPNAELKVLFSGGGWHADQATATGKVRDHLDFSCVLSMLHLPDHVYWSLASHFSQALNCSLKAASTPTIRSKSFSLMRRTNSSIDTTMKSA